MNETIMLMENNDTATIITAIPMNDSTDSNTIADEEENVFFWLLVMFIATSVMLAYVTRIRQKLCWQWKCEQ